MPRVSICIPVYNQPKLLEVCLQNISLQSFKDFEVIITDDSEAGLLLPIVEKYKGKILIKYFHNTTPLGSPKNWNEAIKYSVGDYIKILHHDDSFKHKYSLEKLVKLLDDNHDAKIAFCSSDDVDENGKYLRSHIVSESKAKKIASQPELLFKGNIFGAPSCMIYYKSIDLEFDCRMKWLVDIDFYIRALEKNRFVFTKEKLINIGTPLNGRVTNECIDDKCINIYEHMLLLEKLKVKRLPIILKKHIFKLFKKYDIRNESSIVKCGYTSTVRKEVKNILKHYYIYDILFGIKFRKKSNVNNK